MKKITTPLKEKDIRALKAGEEVLLKGVIYTARDQAHKRLCDLIKKRRQLPFALKNQIIYYCGPTPAPPGKIIGSCGPTTSSRMDKFTIPLLKNGLKGMIGKGKRSAEIISAIKKYKAIYFLAPAGAGAYLSKFVKKKELISWPELGTEAIFRLEVEDFPLIVGIDIKGRSIYDKR
ncbi:MAG: Fe-S-containing hydro-lyase [Candidatus Omnitrophica bacterium]|nr:Fe-S-containing hydro-lyase [Candidatus Omnitrophota bacterium]MCM8792974.1 Fe-S-containing hydro-lyase [Candidatus Omnitrophota bacterium]